MPLWWLSSQRRLVVTVIKKEPNQSYGVVETVEELDITSERAKKDTEATSESDASTTYVGFLFDRNEMAEL
jgi:hypothetical protein